MWKCCGYPRFPRGGYVGCPIYGLGTARAHPPRWRHPMSARVPLAREPDTRGGILPKCDAMSKRKLSEARAESPHKIHSFSTALREATSAEKMRVQRGKIASRDMRGAECDAKFSQEEFQQVG